MTALGIRTRVSFKLRNFFDSSVVGRNDIDESLCSRVATSGGWGGARLPGLGACVVAGCRCQRNWRSPGIFLQWVRGKVRVSFEVKVRVEVRVKVRFRARVRVRARVKVRVSHGHGTCTRRGRILRVRVVVFAL